MVWLTPVIEGLFLFFAIKLKFALWVQIVFAIMFGWTLAVAFITRK